VEGDKLHMEYVLHMFTLVAYSVKNSI